MNEYLQKIINTYNEFKEFTHQINTNDFNKFTRDELKEFIKELEKATGIKYIISDINKIISEKKLEEYPELLGVHHYPEIKELDCISEEDKIRLDNYLVKLGCSSYIHIGSNAWREISKKWSEETQNKILQFLADKNIIEKFYKVQFCEECDNYEILSQGRIDRYLKYFSLKDEFGLISKDNRIIHSLLIESVEEDILRDCEECGGEFEVTQNTIEDIINNTNLHMYKVIKQRDKTYDNL